jgi:cellulose synthase/poly-beta-1,6-N-acetylglucosamine synthase-like glycosyltransferase
MDKLLSVGGFPENFTNEDLPLGYFLALEGERICPVAELENAQSPTTIQSVITQYTTWFYGAMDYFLYYKYASNKLKLPRFKALFWAIVNSIRAAMWLLSPWVWTGLVVYPLYRGKPVLAFAVFCLFLFHTAFSYWLIARFVKKNPQVLGKEIFHIEYNIKTAFAVPVSYIIWGIGPLRSFIQVMTARILGREIYKRKTER